jgi:membrane associated rhomboid family serine protease
MSSFGNQGRYYRPSMFGGFSFFPPVIKGLLIGNGAVFLLLQLLKGFTLNGYSLYPLLNTWFALMPLDHGFMPWQLVTYQFMHWDFLHLLFNMAFGVWMFGMEVEHMWGSKKFLIYYLTCGSVAGLSQLIFAPIFEPSIAPTVGASGAVYGVMVAFASMFPDRLIYFYFLIPVRVKYFVMFLIVLGVFSVGGSSNVANLAHLGGALAGLIYILIERRQRFGKGPLDNLRERMNFSSSSKQTEDVVDATVYDIHTKEQRPNVQSGNELQKNIDEILDKINKSGYQSLTAEEKKILFEASKRMN